MFGRDGQAAKGVRWYKVAPLIGCLVMGLASACGLDVLDGLTKSENGADGGPPGDGDVGPDAGDGDSGPVSPLCGDMKQNGGESAVDCGGDNSCPRCGAGKACSEPSDCASQSCKAKTCAASTCHDQVRNQGEEQVDCGGPCPTCDPCKNGKKDTGEVDIDCGGTCADTACVTGSACTEAADCASGVCASDGKCHAGKRGAYWPAAAWISTVQSASEIPWSSLSHVLVAYVGISPELECAFWTDQNNADKADDAAKKAASALIAYRNAHAKDVRILLSVGGPLLSYRFSAAAKEANRAKFVSSCVSLMAELGADGIDLDWRFPTQFAGPPSGAGKCRDASGCQDATDPQDFTALLGDFRDEFAAVDMAGSLLTAVLRANSESDLNNVPYDYKSFFAGKPRLLDWASVATYELHRPSEAKVDFGAPFPEVIDALAFARDQVGSNNSSSLSLGLSFTGPQWSGVAAPDASGVGNVGTGAGFLSYRTAENYIAGRPAQCSAHAPTTGNTRNHYVYCTGMISDLSNLWISYDDGSVLGNKAKFALINNYAGVTAWLLGQDTANNDLVSAIAQGMDEQNPFGDAPLSLPALVQAEDYDTGGEGKAYHDTTSKNSLGNYRTDDVDIEMCTDRGMGFDLGALASGEWLEYSVAPQAAGKYNVEFRVAAQVDNTKLHLLDNKGAFITPTISVPNTGGAQAWTTVELNTPVLQTGDQQLRLMADNGPFSINWLRFTQGQSPYLGAPVSVPGTVEAEFFDIGGPGVAYLDFSTAQNVLERTGPVSIDVNFESANGMHVRGTQSGEWLEYTIDVEQAGAHNVELRLATGAVHTLHLADGSDNTLTDAPITTPVTGEADQFLAIETRHPITLPSGVQVLRVDFDNVANGNLNFNWMRLTRGLTPYLGAPATIPGTIEAENFDLGGDGIAYHDNTVGNAYTRYRYADVDIQPTTDNGDAFFVTQVEANEWTLYTVNVQETHDYDIEVRAARANNSVDVASMHFEIDNQPVGSAVQVTYTGGTQVWHSFTLTHVPLVAGEHKLRASFETKYASYNWFKFTRSN
jgi:GH18 family chitinase